MSRLANAIVECLKLPKAELTWRRFALGGRAAIEANLTMVVNGDRYTSRHGIDELEIRHSLDVDSRLAFAVEHMTRQAKAAIASHSEQSEL